MLDYSKENYKTFKAYEESFVEDILKALRGTKASYRDKTAYFTGFHFSDTNLGRNLFAEFDVEGETKVCALDLGINSGVIKLEDNVRKVVDEYFEILNKAKAIYAIETEAARKEADEKARIARAKYEAEKARREEIKKQIEADKRYAKRVERALNKLSTLKPEKTEKLFETPTSQYEVIGWMAKHLTSIRAAMPDFMEKWFVGKFGDAERYVVNSKKRTVNGNPMQWGLSLKLTFNKEVVGPLEAKATSQNKKTIDNVAFVWDLIENYGFQFGKEQNISQIKAEVPEQYLPDFEKGYAM